MTDGGAKVVRLVTRVEERRAIERVKALLLGETMRRLEIAAERVKRLRAAGIAGPVDD